MGHIATMNLRSRKQKPKLMEVLKETPKVTPSFVPTPVSTQYGFDMKLLRDHVEVHTEPGVGTEVHTESIHRIPTQHDVILKILQQLLM